MIPYVKKYIITGAPGTGKTTLVSALEKNYPCMHEVSRTVIAREQKYGGNGTPWQDLNKFTELVYEAFTAELKANPKSVFTDRSTLDLIAYLLVEGKTIPSWLDRFAYHNHFRKMVFFAPAWQDIYYEDEQRLQAFEYSLELEKALFTVYMQKQFALLVLPKASVSKRLVFVKEKCTLK